MLTDESLVEEFEIKEDEPWYDHQDLEQDLHLAAELGKTLLDRNTELEEALQQMYTTNEEQLQEIEYLTKQVELLRQMNEQHTKVHEQLDMTARELEKANRKLVTESKGYQQKVLSFQEAKDEIPERLQEATQHLYCFKLMLIQQSCRLQQELTETIESLQVHVDSLQRQVEELKKSGQGCVTREKSEPRRSMHSFTCLKELYDLRKYFVYDHVFAEKITSIQSPMSPLEEENSELKKTLTVLQAQLNIEKERRANIEQEYTIILKENKELEERLTDLDCYRAQVKELEAEVVEMRQACQSDSLFVNRVEQLVPESFLISFRESCERDTAQSPPAEETVLMYIPESNKSRLKRSSSESFLQSATTEEILNGHEETCIRRAEAVKRRGVSLLNEVDAQYSALQAKYEELLKRCQSSEDSPNHKAVQTLRRHSRDLSGTKFQADEVACSSQESFNRELSSCTSRLSLLDLGSTNASQPEYKVLFKEIFSCIKKTKEEIDEHRTKYKHVTSEAK
nr:PREDICTED: cerebellar degeneration-related protein 2 isoform X1 [Latimeria chalumnae]|eukprot:XP_005998441.1 PREDICTED: cerebellar degeneration-related protein 2 isoform X1 [Latimeria chalumnae]